MYLDSNPSMATRSRRKQQTRLSFQPLPSSSPAKDHYSSAVQDRLASVRFQDNRSSPRRSTRSLKQVDADTLPTPEPSSQPQVKPDPFSPSSNAAPNQRRRHGQEPASPSEPQDSEEDEIVVPSSKRRKLSSTGDSETPTRRSARLQDPQTPPAHSSPGRVTRSTLASSPPVRQESDLGSPETSGDDEVAIISKPAQRRRATRKVSDDPFVVSDYEEGDPIRRRPRKVVPRGQDTNGCDFVVADDEIEYISSDDAVIQSSKPKSSKRRRERRSRKEQNELEEDLDDLRDSERQTEDEEGEGEDPANGSASRRTRGGPVTTARDRTREHIEELKRRRAGEGIPRVVESEDEDHVDAFDEDDGADLDQIVHERRPSRFEAEVISSESEAEKPRSEHANDKDEEEDDFVVDDEEEDVDPANSRRPQSGIPLAFTSFASSKPRELFVHIVEWLVKNKIAPAFSRNDELYALSWNKINDQIKAQAGSRLISSAWNEDFKNTILARPQMQVNYLGQGDDEFFLNCDACNRTNHPARYEFKFAGHAYHKDTLEPIDEDAEDEESEEGDEEASDEEADTASYDQAGHLLPSTRVAFNLGSHCAANAEMGHKLTHWKFHLNQALLAYLEEQGVLSAESIVARERLSKKKREKEAENIVDTMQDTGVVNEFWRDLQNDLEDARFGMEDHVARGGGRRNKNRIGKVRVNRGDGRIEEWGEGGRMRVVIPDDSD